MANTTLFKNTAGNVHRNRYVTTIDDFSSGMKYTNAPHEEGNAKAIVNFDFKNDGECMVPRGGLHTIHRNISAILYSANAIDYCVHHATSAYVLDADESDATLCQYIITGPVHVEGFSVAAADVIVEYNGTFIRAIKSEDSDYTGYMLMQPALSTMQGMVLDTPKSRSGIYTSLEGNTYVLVRRQGSNKLCRLVLKFNAQRTEVTWTLDPIVPKEVQPPQAMNYGYNMFKDNPYTFTNVLSSTDYIQLTGVIPYDENGKVLLTARPGAQITFKLYYKYPEIDVQNHDKYMVQWEMQDLNNSSDSEVIQKVRSSKQYAPGEEVSITCAPSFNAFSLIVRFYKKSEMDAQDAAWEADPALQALVTKDQYLAPNQVTTLASYYLTNNGNSSTLNVDASIYDMGTATGMCTWQQRIVMWGVQGAKSTLFVSEINDPSYMPYPNNCEIFSADVICAVPYLTNLLVFTKNGLYKLTFNDDGLTYTTKCVQERLNMTPSDAATVVVVQNMVYFKSGNYFYMVVPNNTITGSDTQLAPVSRSVEQMFDNLASTLSGVINEVYNLDYDGYHNPIEITLIDYNVYVADTQVRNVYKVEVTKTEAVNTRHKYVLDVCINYDTVLRAWTMYMYESNYYRTVLYKPTVTGKSVLTNMYYNEYIIYTSLIQEVYQTPSDTFELSNNGVRTFGNWQYIDTGYRDFQEDLKKRFREVQFCVNIINSEVLKFHTAFVVDDVEVVPFYKHVVSHCTDPADTNYGMIFVERELVEPTATPDLTELNTWSLDTSMFPDITVHKVRYKVSGKGYGGSVKLLSMNEVPYELLHINWVYRVMFSR